MLKQYQEFLQEFDLKLKKYSESHKDHIYCKAGCSSCCEKGDYPISQLELEYLMQGFIALDNDKKLIIQSNFKEMKKGEACPFLLDKKCSVYEFRPIICRVHGLCYLCKDDLVKLPYCVNESKNYSKVYKDGNVEINPVLENLDTPNVLKGFYYGEIRNLYDWITRKGT